MAFPKPTTSFAPVDDIIMEALNARVLMEALGMKLFDHLSGSPMPASQLAQSMGFDAERLESFLDILANRELLSNSGGTYANTPRAEEFLVSTASLYQGQAMEMQRIFNDNVCDNISALLKGEGMAREKTDDSWSDGLTMDGMLQHALTGQLQEAVEFIGALPEFPSFRTMADVGGNHGHYTMELLEQNPDLTGTILDLPDVMEPARARCERFGFGKRITCQPFDLRTDDLAEEAYDLVLTSHMLYACEEDLETPLARIFKSVKPGGCFVSHHFAREGGASQTYKTTVELLTRLSGYGTHFLSRSELEKALGRVGFSDFSHTFTGTKGQTLLLVARKQ